MADFEIIVDSGANIPDEIVRQRGIQVIPYHYTVNGEEHSCVEEGRPFSETAKEFYKLMRAGADVKTSLISQDTFEEVLAPFLEAGKDVLLFTIASGISGTYQQALNAQKSLNKRFPKQKVFVLDSANASMGTGLLAIKVADLRDMGESAEACADWVKRNAYFVNSYVAIDDLKYLRKGGRISLTLAIAGTILNIKPLLKADGGAAPKLAFYAKARGRKKSISALVEAFDKNVVRPEAQTIAITHADCEEEAQALAKTLKEHGARDVIVEYYDICTGIHVGPGTIAVFFVGKNRKNGEFSLPELKPHGKTVAVK